MRIGVLKEDQEIEKRVALTPQHVEKLTRMGAAVVAEAGLGECARHSDEAYRNAGAQIVADRSELLASCEMVLAIRKLPLSDVGRLASGSIIVSLLDPFNESETIAAFVERKVTAVSMEMIPRITRAQKMDVLSSQANLAGYVAVIVAAERLDKLYPMMMTPAGTISPARVFVIGAGVAGLQAIATAKRLGARVEAFDTRPVVEEQVRSLGARFVKVDLGETGQTKDGYAKALTDEQLQRQRDAMAKVCAKSDVVITTAQLFGRKAPLIVTEEMLSDMQPGSVVVDLAVESGGNVAGAVSGRETVKSGVHIIGLTNLPGRVAVNASQMYSANLFNFIDEFWSSIEKRFVLNFEDEIARGCVITHDGRIVNDQIAGHLS
jgi:NAD(P) transhydrogenase subunit alpha